MTESDRLLERARRVLPGGVNSAVRAWGSVGGTPFFVDRASGPYLWDVDGRRYIDYVMSFGPLIHGHAFGAVVRAVEEQAAFGSTYGAPSAPEVELAELVVAAMPSVEMVRFVNSGTEATISVLSLARAFTGRDLIVTFEGNYHGHAVSAGSHLRLPYNDSAALVETFESRGGEIAAAVLEPIGANAGLNAPGPQFLRDLRALTEAAGALLIADEVVTGFRVALGGAQSLYDLRPDLTTLGKVVGGGLSVGAYGGRADVMQYLAPLGPVYQGGTLSGNPLAMRAGIATLQPLRDPDFYTELAAHTERLATGLCEKRPDEDGVRVDYFPGLLHLRLSPDGEQHAVRYARFFHAMLRRGVYLPPAPLRVWMVSAAHTDEVIESTIVAAHGAFQETFE